MRLHIPFALTCLFVVNACQQQKSEPASATVEPTKAEAAAEPAEAEAEVAAEPATAEADEATPTATAEAAPAENNVHNVACACSLKEGEFCANMIEVDGRYLLLEGKTGLEETAFCGKKGLQVKAEGKVDGESFVATSVELIKPAK